MARDAGVKAAEYVIQQWPELFPSRDFSPVRIHKVLLKALDLLCCRTSDLGNQCKKIMKRNWNVCVCVI